MSFVVRAAQQDEYEEILDVTGAAFGRDPQHWGTIWKNDVNDSPELHRVGVLDGKIVAAVRIADRKMRVGCAVVNLGGIADVATHPDYRSRGFSTACLEDAIRFMEGNDYDLSMLFTGIQPFYRKLGWEVFPTYYETYSPLDPEVMLQRPLADNDLRIEQFTKEQHLSFVSRIHDEFNRLRTGTIVRGVDHYGGTLHKCHESEGFLVVLRGEDIVAYVRGGFGETSTVFEYGTSESGRAEGLLFGLRELVQRAHAHGSTALNIITMPPIGSDDEFEFFETGCWDGAQVDVTERTNMMFRLVDLNRFVIRILPVLRKSASSNPMHVAFKVGGTMVGINSDGSEVSVTDGTDTLGVMSVSPITLLQFLFGCSTIPMYFQAPWSDFAYRATHFTWWAVDNF